MAEEHCGVGRSLGQSMQLNRATRLVHGKGYPNSRSGYDSACFRNNPTGPCRYIENTWALEGLLDHDFRAYVCSMIMVLGRSGQVHYEGASR